ncbi:hypothetical protein CFRA_09395 [Corynebacterium frankenforstense DSM 45800]|uniref:DUF3558 domain-containing protein n=1 Tax=Corynebacterium frankenforstense DSM 45800 TaxID=1437875 RepID=A0A1L7CUB7_9CORY|nr:hypothetical protein [Corynebacterium frankenforstense]APT89427.1 hypothetical protein CFRA_09395 [Corynebacterium frankenforstense DSM 45800]
MTTLATVTVAGLLTAGCAGPAGPVLDTVAAANDRLDDYRRDLAHAGKTNGETGDDSATVSASDGPTLFGVPSSKLPFEPGEIDMATHPDEQFNPCTEISPEIYRQAGLELEIEPDMDKLAGYVASCTGYAASSDSSPRKSSDGRFQILSSRSTLDDLQTQGIEVLELSQEQPFSPHLVNGTAGRNECVSGVSTNRGRWEVIFTPALNTGSTEESCKRAREAHEKITKLIGGNAP